MIETCPIPQYLNTVVADPGVRPPPQRTKIFLILCSFWGKLAKWYAGAPPRGLAPPPMGNAGSVPALY